jgi:hypothetical protein
MNRAANSGRKKALNSRRIDEAAVGTRGGRHIVRTSPASLVAAKSPPVESVQRAPVIRIDTGDLRGQVAGNTLQFRGIPYLAPPLGERRFAPPAPALRCEGSATR